VNISSQAGKRNLTAGPIVQKILTDRQSFRVRGPGTPFNMGAEKNGKLEKMEIDEDENVERGNWTGKLDFLLSCLGYAVGLGNVWRFPYLCFKNGGGSFLVPYFLMLAIIGIPTFLLELNIGQYSALGPVTLYSHLSPVFKGLGFANYMANAFVGLYYNMIIAWTIYYLFASFTSDLPWQYCDNDFNDDNCFSFSGFKDCDDMRKNLTDKGIENNIIFINRTCITDPAQLAKIRADLPTYYGGTVNKTACLYTNLTYCDTDPSAWDNIDRLFDQPLKLRKSSSEQYLTYSVLGQATEQTIEPADFGSPSWSLALCLLAAWLVIFLCLIKGIQSSGKVVYFTATFPYVVLVILLVRAVTLEGAEKGINFYLVPDWDRLSDIKVWESAAVQIFFSLSVAGGGLITLSSYNRFHNNILRDTLIVCIGNCLTSFVAGFAIFSVLGFMATQLGVEVKDVATSGTGLAFVAYPDLVTRLPLPTLWAILFFLMLFTLGLDSQFAIVETVLTGILDFRTSLRPKKTLVVGVVCLVGFILGLPLCCPGGSLLLDLLDFYAASWPYLFIGLMELIIISYIYGYANYIDDLFEMTGFRGLYMMKWPMAVFYCFLSPLAIAIIFVFSWYNYEPLKVGDYVFPGWANGIGWLIAMTAILAVPFMAVVTVVRTVLDGKDLSSVITPTPSWRQNAVRVNGKDGEKSDFEYREGGPGGSMIRYRRGEAPVPVSYNYKGYDNRGLVNSRSDITMM